MTLSLTRMALLRQPYKQACFLSLLLFPCLLKCKPTPNFWLHLPMVTYECLFIKITLFFIYWCLMKPTTASTHLKKICSSHCVFSPSKSHLSPKWQVFQSRGWVLDELLSPGFENCGWPLLLPRDSALHARTGAQSKAGRSTEAAKRADVSLGSFHFQSPSSFKGLL